ncbi:MAG: glycogen-binding domain-containing protein [Gemmatimonadota bacterium]|nr:glycogen-binding domain-containing protein [Gemmatimonadota bacterium]
MGRAICGVLGLLVAIAWGQQLGAQVHPVVDVGISAARFTEDDISVIGPQLRVSIAGAQRQLFGSAEIGAMGTNTAAIGFADIRAGIRSITAGAVHHDLVADISAAGNTTSAGQAVTALLGARTAYEVGSVGGWIRGSSQLASRETDVFFGGSVDASSWWKFGRNELSATLLQEWTRATLYAGPQRYNAVGTAPVQYLEGGLSIRAESEATAVTLDFTSRRDAGANHLFEPAFAASAVFWTGGSTAVVLSAAHQLPDYVRGSDALDGVSVSVRFGQASPAVARATVHEEMIQFTGTADMRTVRIHVPDARAVEIMGDFTDWEPRPMVRNGAAFESTMRVTSGTHRLMLRIDGGEWRAPANTPTVDDDFGGRVGLLAVP